MQTVIKNPNWWRRRTRLERCLTLLSAFALMAVIGLIIGLVSVILTNRITEELQSPPPAATEALLANKMQEPLENNCVGPQQEPDQNVCLTSDCIYTASDVLQKMKPEIEPCDDFYQFVCGSYIDTETIPEDKVSVNTFSVLSDKLQQQLRDIITEKRPETDPKHFRLPNTLYQACMNKSLIETLGSDPITKISDSLGGWPLLKGADWNSDKTWSWQEQTKKFRKNGFSMDYILDFSIGVDLKNSTKRIIDIDQPQLGLNREYFIKGFNETFVVSYYSYMVDMAVLFGANKEEATEQMKAVIEFEMAVSNISWSNEKRRNSNDLYNLRTIKQMQETYPYVQWLDYINALLPTGLVVDENEVINLSVPSFMDELGPLLKKTPDRVIANYMMWRIHNFAISFLSEEYRKRQLQYITELSGRQEQEQRWKECVDITAGSDSEDADDPGLAISIGSLYVRKHFDETSRSIAMDMVHDIRSVFSDILKQVEWMDDMTKVEAQKKLKSMSTHIGYPIEMTDNDKLADYYNNLDINPDKYFESFLKMNVFGTDKSFNKLREPVNKTDWVRHARPAVVNAYYSSIENSIQFPAGILQGHFFNAKRPRYMNFGAIGYVIGHEITHGFDDQGRQFDVDGNLIDWWQEDTKKAYLEKAQCIIHQYGNYTDRQTGLNLNGINTQGENIADNGGVKESYIAYNRWADKNKIVEPQLPGLNYTAQQMFWISAGQTWCAKYRKESLKMRITTGVHSPSEFRVLGSFSNMKAFAKDFQCPEGTRMNPIEKCEVW